jgi:hypothetical protein
MYMCNNVCMYPANTIKFRGSDFALASSADYGGKFVCARVRFASPNIPFGTKEEELVRSYMCRLRAIGAAWRGVRGQLLVVLCTCFIVDGFFGSRLIETKADL